MKNCWINRKIVFAMIIGFSLLANHALADTSVWKVSKGKNYFYIGGTVHLLTAEDHPLPEEFIVAYRDASEIFFETDLVAIQAPAFQARLIAAMTYSDGRTLASELEPKIYRKLESFMASRQIPIAQFSKFKPWGISLMLSLLEYQRLGMLPAYGVDSYFNNLALADKKKTVGLESPEEQLRFLSSMAGIDPNSGVEYTLRDLKRLPEFVNQMKSSWRSGDLESFSKSAFITQMKMEFPELYNNIVSRRNMAWMKQLPALTDDNDNEFVLVGAMHLHGNDGLLNLLEKQGFLVEQL